MNRPVAQASTDIAPAQPGARRVVMVTSPGEESSLTEVVMNLATVSAEIGQRVVILSTAGLAGPEGNSELPLPASLWWKQWPSPRHGSELSPEDVRVRLLTGPVSPADVEDLLGDTGIPGVSQLDIRHFVGHPAQVVVRAPEVLDALLKIVDVVILEVPSYLSVHHGEGLTPLADAVLVVGERRTTSIPQVRRASAALTRLGAPVVGMTLTRPAEEKYDWGRDDESELEASDEEPNGVYDTTEQIPLTESTAVEPAGLVEEGAVDYHAPPEA
jgi:hypothetical protein